MKKWEAPPDGIKFKKWEVSLEGQKVLAGAAKIRNYISASANIEAVITSLSFPPGLRLGFGVMVKINGDDYILSFGPEKSNEFQQLHSLDVCRPKAFQFPQLEGFFSSRAKGTGIERIIENLIKFHDFSVR